MDIELNPTQYDFVTDTKTKHIGFCAGFGSGKTWALCIKAIHLATLNIGYDLVLLEPTTPMLKTIAIPKMEELLEMFGIRYDLFLSQKPRFILHFDEGDVVIHLMSAENYTRLVGFEVAAVLLDETDTIKPEIADLMYKKLQGRLRTGNVRQICVASTPEGFGWMHDFYINNPKEDKVLYTCSTYENAHNLPDDYISDLKESYPPNLIEAYLHGKFVNLTSGSVYSNYDRYVNHTGLTLKDFPDSKIIHIGVDFNVNKTCGIVSVVDNLKVYVVDEITGQKDTDALIISIQQRFQNRKLYIYPDSSGKSEKTNSNLTDIFKLQNAFGKKNVFFNKKNPPVIDRVNSVNAMFMSGAGLVRMYVNEDTAPTIAQNLEQQSWTKEGKPDKMHDADHCPDGLGYFIMWRFPIIKKGGIKTK